MSKIRWRDVKSKEQVTKENKIDSKESLARVVDRVKAFITDMFMIYVPIIYIVGYIIFGGAEDFRESQLAPLLTLSIYGVITVIFWIKSGQTPGYRAYSLRVIDSNTKENISILKAILRFTLFIFSATVIFGILIALFRKDRKTLYDLLSKSEVIKS